MPKPLSKSRFKIGAQCPTKLFYSVRPEYGNTNDINEFLKALADGGFQVGALATLYYPGGIKIETLDYNDAIKQTDELLKRKQVTIYEAAFAYRNLFIRVDVLVKNGNSVELTEVKAKSFDSTEPFVPFNKKLLKSGKYQLKADWGEYLLDLAFQTYVLQKAKPEFQVSPGLMLADKSKMATVDGLNQLFLIQKTKDNRADVRITPEAAKKDLGEPILTRLDLKHEVETIIQKAKMDWADDFETLVERLAKLMESGERFSPSVGGQCKSCEFRINAKDFPKGSKSGFQECWSMARKLKPDDFKKEFVFDVWNFRGSEKAVQAGKIFASDLDSEDINLKEREGSKAGLSNSERQLIQVEFAKGERKGVLIDTEGLANELKLLKAPYHFIDFETAMAAIPFHAGRRPYEQMAFQFSHHVVDEQGRFEHRTEYLNDKRGEFPNFNFVRALKKALEKDQGTVFRFASHENTVLNQIHAQLAESSEPDRDELMSWIETLTTPPDKHEFPWAPNRSFVDMCDFTKRYYYLPETRGSNSIKKLLPAVLNHAGREMQSKFPNFIEFDSNGKALDPYKKLPPIFSDIPPEEIARMELRLIEREDLNDGGAAMTAWARMQFTEMSETERKALRVALLRYCHLDTLAMVMIWEWWQLEIRRAKKSAA